MCGIAGFLAAHWPTAAADALGAMTHALKHRGPDDADTWLDCEARIALGHRRLSIIDLSPDGRQPMHSPSGRYVLVFNGEIYNFQALRGELERRHYRFRGHSDTEVMLAATEEWGIEECLQRCNGMFSIALWDRARQTLHLARDRIGKKPLYYGWSNGTLLFGSELKSLLQFSGFAPQVDRNSLALFLRYNYVPAPWSILRGVFKLVPGTLLSITAAHVAGGAEQHEPLRDCKRYWNPQEVLGDAVRRPFDAPATTIIEQLDALLRDAVALRMYADVPLGAFLSGGTDSSTVVALMQAQARRPIRTFSIGFDDPRHDEASYARAVATHLGTDHTELYVKGEDALTIVPNLPQMFDEPFADSSQIPTYLVAKLARQHVTVALSGDGGDELFCGYGRYQRAMDVWKWHQRLPDWMRRLGTRALNARAGREGRVDKLAQLASELQAQTIADVYKDRVSRWRFPEAVVRSARESPNPFTDPQQQLMDVDDAHALMYLDLITYLPEDILTKVDRATMAVGLEARAPLLDYRVVEFAFHVPIDLKVREAEQKWILKELLRRYLPDPLVYRPKKGFGAPVAQWLRGPLRDWAAQLLDAKRLTEEGHFDVERVVELWDHFLGGQRKWHTHLWNVLMFQAWLDWLRTQPASDATCTYARRTA